MARSRFPRTIAARPTPCPRPETPRSRLLASSRSRSRGCAGYWPSYLLPSLAVANHDRGLDRPAPSRRGDEVANRRTVELGECLVTTERLERLRQWESVARGDRADKWHHVLTVVSVYVHIGLLCNEPGVTPGSSVICKRIRERGVTRRRRRRQRRSRLAQRPAGTSSCDAPAQRH